MVRDGSGGEREMWGAWEDGVHGVRGIEIGLPKSTPEGFERG